MILFLLRKKLQCFSLFPKSSSSAYAFRLLRPSSLSSSIENPPPPKPNFMTEFLMTSCGFSPERAADLASKRISHITSPLKPDSVRHFLERNGFTNPQIRTLVANYPPILCSTGKNMESNLRSLREMGLSSEPELRNVIARNPQALLLASAIPRFEFWRAFFDGDTKSFNLAFTRNLNLISMNIDTGIAPKVALLKKYDLPQTCVKTILLRGPGFIRLSTARIESLLKRVEEFGFPRGSPMFVLAVLAFYGLKKGTLNAKMDLYRSLGWSEVELTYAILRFPFILRLSEENIRSKMAFFVKKAGCTLGYIALFPAMIGYSLEKRLAPRHRVMQILKSNLLLGTKPGFYYTMTISDKTFMERFVLPHKDSLPALLKMYVAARAAKILL